jgi:hypothetical protein
VVVKCRSKDGAKGICGADIEAEAPVKMWDAFRWNSPNQMGHLRRFMLSIGNRYQELMSDATWSPQAKTTPCAATKAGAYCARTPTRMSS